jgi:hypothetical protein
MDFEARLEEIAREIVEIRRELEAIVNDVAGGDLAKAFVFLEIPSNGLEMKGATVVVDGKTVFSRPFTPAELDVLNRGLPLELAELRVAAGEHRVALFQPGSDSPEPAVFSVARGGLAAWVGSVSDAGIQWRVE